ncbi:MULTISPECIES: DUF3644 domain-containing protein [Corynebacterium]|uniref:DUF3644 domain-containing protein n=1 Tax=Corynebacterium ihumii TaxID=1232427 RepID=A0ABY7UAC8_9CORY|nr:MULTISPECIES: DUF3644 domain-containing protein [Corynebacterium]WCZ33624.1 hypothetical protein CIHUM_00880 [Corynebacterium ihumii]
MDEGQEQIVERLLEKSKEAFALGVELYNRPTLKYHAETCSIFLCNAWELMLKAHLIQKRGIDSIYYSDGSGRTLALKDCLKKVYTNDKDPLRVNMDELIKFRNVNTHFITDEYEIFIGPFLQKSVMNYADKLLELHGESVSDLIPENYLALAVRRGTIDPDIIRAKYEPRVAEKLLKMSRSAADAAGTGEGGSAAAIYETNLRIVKKAQDADLNVYVDNTADAGVAIVKDVRDAASYYPYTAKNAVQEVKSRLENSETNIYFRGEKRVFNKWHFDLFSKVFQFKGDERYAHDRSTAGESNPSWTYSQRAIEFIVAQLKKEPETCIDALQAKAAER